MITQTAILLVLCVNIAATTRHDVRSSVAGSIRTTTKIDYDRPYDYTNIDNDYYYYDNDSRGNGAGNMHNRNSMYNRHNTNNRDGVRNSHEMNEMYDGNNSGTVSGNNSDNRAVYYNETDSLLINANVSVEPFLLFEEYFRKSLTRKAAESEGKKMTKKMTGKMSDNLPNIVIYENDFIRENARNLYRNMYLLNDIISRGKYRDGDGGAPFNRTDFVF